METVTVNLAMISNFEVMQVLQEIKDSKENKKFKRECSLATLTYEALRYLQEFEYKNQNELQIAKFLEALKAYKLTKTEKLMMLNTPPRSPIEIQLIVQESEERLSEKEVEEIINLVNEVLPLETE